jgi:hypothetical protein
MPVAARAFRCIFFAAFPASATLCDRSFAGTRAEVAAGGIKHDRPLPLLVIVMGDLEAN